MPTSETPDLETLRRENARLRRAVSELTILNELATAIGTAHALDDVIHTIVQGSLRAVGAEQGVIKLVDETAIDPMKTLIRTTVKTAGTHEPYRLDAAVLAWMQHHKASLIINDPHHDERFPRTQWDATIRSVLSVPMMAQSKLVGILTVYNKRGDEGFQYADQRLLSIIAGQSASIVENARLHDERNEIVQLFGQHTAPAVVDALLRVGADTTTRRHYVCVMFLDIRDFTMFSQQHTPEEIVEYLNTLFEFTIDLINRHHGIIHQLLGDGFMAIFGAPLSYGNDCQHAVMAALSILRRVARACAAGLLPPTRLGIGLHAGEVVAGTVGSVIHKEYKVTGDAVNLAARIEQLTKKHDAQLLVSEAVWQALEPGRFEGASIGSVDVRGRAGAVHLYKLA